MSAAKVTWYDPWDAVWERVKKEKEVSPKQALRKIFPPIDHASPAWQTLREAWFRFMDTIKIGASKRTYERGCRLLAEYMMGDSAVEKPVHGIPDAFFHLMTGMDDKERYEYVDQWLAYMSDNGLSLKSIGTYLCGPRGFSTYLYKRGLAPNCLHNKIYQQLHPSNPRTTRRRPKTVQTTQIERMMGQIDTGTPQGARDYAIFRVMVDLGLRVSECLSIKRDDYKPAEGHNQATLRVASAKTRAGAPTEFTDYRLPLQTDHAIRHWLATPPSYVPKWKPVDTLFYMVSGKRLGDPVTSRTMSRAVDRYCKAAFVTPFPLHGLRRYAGNHARRAMEKLGLDKGDVMDFMRHKHWATTEIYTQPDPDARFRLAQAVASSIEPRRTVDRILNS